jgi:hypothetical protein
MVDTNRSAPINMEEALHDPASVFATPEEVLSCGTLSRQQKAEILRRWEYDASEASVAEEEGMPNQNGDLLGRILLVLENLADIDMDRIGPTKQHGIPRSALKRK